MRRRILLVLCAVFCLFAVFCAWKLADIHLRNARQQQAFDDLLPDSQPRGSAPAREDVPQDTVLPEYQALFATYPDMVGWLDIDDSPLHYPLMQTPDDPDYYLRRDLQGQYSTYGVPYLAAACEIDTSDNLIAYGHSMSNGDMFGSLLEYTDAAYWQEHPTIRLTTRTEVRQYTILGVFAVDVSGADPNAFAYHTFTKAADEAEYLAWVQRVQELSFYDTGVQADYGSQLLTLSTCEYTLPDGRLVVVAVRTA